MSFIKNLRTIIESMNAAGDDEPPFVLSHIQSAIHTATYGIPPPPEPAELLAHSRKTWVPPGTSVTVAGRVIPQGAVYVGKHLPPISGWDQIDPALIDPSLSLTTTRQEANGYFSMYASSYSHSSPDVRARYLDWLATGQPAGSFPTLPYLRLYGLERRILFDARHDKTARAEVPALIEEVRRLERGIENDRAFRSHVTELFVTSLLLHGIPTLAQIEPAIDEHRWELPMALLVGLGLYARQRQPLPAAWALSWICNDPKTNLRTAATRLPAEFRALFAHRYGEAFGEGMLLNAPKHELDIYLQPSSPSFGGYISVPPIDLPDLGRARKPQRLLREIVESTMYDLDEYSRIIGTSGDKHAPLALAVRPWALGSIADEPSLAPLSAVLKSSLGDRPMGLVDVPQMLESIPGLSQPPTQKQLTSISRLAHRLGYGFEPDPGQSRKAFIDSERVGIYRRDDTPDPLSNLSIQQMALSLSALIIGVDGVLDIATQNDLLNRVATIYPIRIEDTYRLAAHLDWLAARPMSFAEAKRQWNRLDLEPDESLATLLIQVAARDGQISTGEMRMFARIYPLLGRSEHQLHSDVHQRFAGTLHPASSPSQRTQSTSDATPTGHVIDARVVRHVQAQTDDIQAVLGALFAEEEPAPASSAKQQLSHPAANDPYRQLIAELIERPSCTLAELTVLATGFGLMASGAIETINDRAIDRGFDPPIECDDRCDIDVSILRELLGHD